MSMIIAHNMSAINTQRQFGVSARGMSNSMEKLSSGFKINTGKDDPSGLLISEKLRSQLAGIQRAKQNTEEAMNVMGIAEGALAEMNNIMKKMKSLATHASNNGVTTADQIEADQSELDSAIQTIDRIAQTTQFSRENILNGAKELSFSTATDVKGTQQNALIDERDSTFNQIFKRDGYSVSIGFTGGTGNIVKGYGVDAANGVTHAGSALTGDGKNVNFSMQATKAYMEVDTAIPDGNSSVTQPKAQVINGLFTQEQQFTLTGSLGSRQFTFAKNKSITDLVKDIHNTAGSTGVDASLIFNSDQKINCFNGNAVTAGSLNGTAPREAGSQSIFGSSRGESGNAAITTGAIGAELEGIQFGRNTDGQGNVYIKYIDDYTVELYKDSAMTPESMVATGRRDTATNNVTLKSVNNSGLTGTLTVVSDDDDFKLADLKNNYVNTGGIEGTNGVMWSGDVGAPTGCATQGMFDANNSVITGIELGRNTSTEGKIYFRTVNDGNGIQVYAYKDKQMRQEDLVAQSDYVAYANSQTIVLNQIMDSNNTYGTGLGIVLSSVAQHDDTTKGVSTGNLTFENLGARIFASEYGSDNFIKITQDKGGIFTSFDSPGDEQRTLLEAGANSGKTKLIYGQDATVSVNGMEVKTNGLTLSVATQDIQANLSFNAGKVGSTTIAQVGYDTGSPFTRAGALNLGSNVTVDSDGLSAYLCNAGHTTNETIGDFQGGMQLQLGEGAGDQNRTVVSLKSMTTENLGRITRGGYWDSANPSVWSEKTFTLKDCFGGGAASLAADPTLTMAVIDRAIDDIAGQRALIGAMQANLLQTNANNLEVTYENVTKTESGIRDADMAAEMAEFTKNQVLQSAATSMMSQANQRSQQALQLLQ